ncbi:uncharacterized protein [Solanum tuberosum]|uniref:uncharacterized protein n=1 Tax=Solanum tuberosum TaxID=4113 RepID=UPI00073A0712|nr:PREDICTED: uncharacterized protein LOC107062294 [Solanum tuberosum]
MRHICGVYKGCGLESETIDHMLFRCPSAQLVWKICPINWPNLENIVDFAGWWNDLFTNVKKYPDSIELIKLSFSIMWQIWKARNSKSFNGEISNPNDIVNKALFDFHEYESNLIPLFSPIVIPACNDDRNITMAQNDIVVFADASVHKEKKTTNIGVVAMDSYGNLLHYFGTPIQYVGKAITAEAIAIRMAMENAREKG